MWACHKVQVVNTSTNKFFKATDESGTEHLFTSVGEASRMHDLNLSAVHRCLSGKLHTHHGWSDFQYLEPTDDEVFRYNHIDQLKNVVATIRQNPDSRRNIITLWNPHEIDRVTLPPCHGNIIQFNCEGNFLDLHMYQRSADILLGVPVNIASYALLLQMLAHITNRTPRMLYTSYGDLHIYTNHLEQAKLQMTRKPFPAPTVVLSPHVTEIDNFTFEDISLCEYECHPAIKAEVAV